MCSKYRPCNVKRGIDINDASLDVMTEMKPNKEQIQALQQAVAAIHSNIQTLKDGINTPTGGNMNITEKDSLISKLRDVTTNQDSFNCKNGWYWYPTTWQLTQAKLQDCNKKMKKIKDDRYSQGIISLIDQCAVCISDMESYKILCESILAKDERSWSEWLKSFRITSKLEALKALAS